MCESADRVEQDWESDAADVIAFRERLGLPSLIDVHTHFMPKRVMDKVWAYFDSAGPLIGREWPIRYRMEEDSRVEHLRAFGVSHFTSMLYPHKPDMAAWLNQWAADFAARTPDCLHTATFYPEESAPEYVTAALDAGTRVFKSHIQVGEYDPGDPLLDPVWGLLEDSGTPIVIHCGSGPAPGRFTGPDRIARLLARHPRLALVIAHMGMPEYSEFLDLADRYPSVYLDTTMAFTDFTEAQVAFPRGEVSRLRDLGERILFGSDYPNIPYSYRDALDALERFDLGDDWVRAVVHHNATKLFDLS
ncbi:hypothetical protein DEU38_11849 [Rhodococcus sp. AG1013]|nr:hypothetical protein DEU38_11849 [Rhodococcus sp. AG1013]